MSIERELLKQALNIVDKAGKGILTMGESLAFYEKIERELSKPNPEPIAFLRDDGDGYFEFTSHDDELGYPVYK